jgi:micrococcal nuclease
MTLRALGSAIILSLAFSGAAQAATCRAAPPADAAEFRGPVLEVVDGDRLCVALGADPANWVLVRLADEEPAKASTTPASRGALMAASFGHDVTCRITGRDADGVIAQCAGDRGSLRRLSQGRAAAKAGLDWR